MTFAKGQTDLGEPAFGLQVGTFFFWPKKTDGIEQNSSKTFEASLGVPES
jgi:hypothetical protein